MESFDIIKGEFSNVLQRYIESSPMRRIADGKFTIEHYKSCLREAYFYTRENPQIQAQATIYFRGRDREVVRLFYRHASQEIGHDQLIINDLKMLGVGDADKIRTEFPLSTTIALVAFPYFQIQHRNPIGYLGYLFFLEFMPTTAGNEYKDMLIRSGIPPEATSFIQEHTKIDVAHNRLMEDYANALIQTDADLESVIYALRTTGVLFSAMMAGAIEQSDAPRPSGIDRLESNRFPFSESIKKCRRVGSTDAHQSQN